MPRHRISQVSPLSTPATDHFLRGGSVPLEPDVGAREAGRSADVQTQQVRVPPAAGQQGRVVAADGLHPARLRRVAGGAAHHFLREGSGLSLGT